MPEEFQESCQVLIKIEDGFKCEVCKTEDFISLSGVCEPRVKIENCEKHIPNIEGCDTCIEGFVMATDKPDICIPKLVNCDEHTFNAKGEILSCSQCADNHVLINENQNGCSVADPNLNCLRFNRDRTCSRCQHDYML